MSRSAIRTLITVSLGAIHVAAFVSLLGARLSIRGAPAQTLVESVLAFPFVWLVNYLPGPDLFAIAVILNGLLWGWALSMLIDRFFFRAKKPE